MSGLFTDNHLLCACIWVGNGCYQFGMLMWLGACVYRSVNPGCDLSMGNAAMGVATPAHRSTDRETGSIKETEMLRGILAIASAERVWPSYAVTSPSLDSLVTLSHACLCQDGSLSGAGSIDAPGSWRWSFGSTHVGFEASVVLIGDSASARTAIQLLTCSTSCAPYCKLTFMFNISNLGGFSLVSALRDRAASHN